MNILHTINSFKTKQVLNKNYEKYSNYFETDKWWGEYSKEYDLDTVKKILELFQTQRDDFFELARKSDYKDTWKSKDLETPCYVKHYRVFDSQYRKILIYKRNILRRNLAKKGYAINFYLEDFGIPTIKNIFFAANKDSYISHTAFYVSSEEKNAITIKYYFINWLKKVEAGGYTIDIVDKFPNFSADEILFELGKIIKKMLDNGVRLPPKEYLGNILIIPLDENKFELKLCDPEGIDIIQKYTKKEKEDAYIKIRDKIELTLKQQKIVHNIAKLDINAKFDIEKKEFFS